MVPVPAEIRRRPGDDDQVAHTSGDVLVAPGAQVCLAGLVRLHGAYLELLAPWILIHRYPLTRAPGVGRDETAEVTRGRRGGW